jgi:hypothetical protein
VSGPCELAQAVPYLLGFHPKDSLVVVGLCGGRVVVTARVDLADVVDPVEAVSLPATLAAMARSEVTRVVGLVYDEVVVDPETGRGLPWAEVAEELSSAARLVGLELGEAALVSGGRLWSYLCDDPRCCPPQGRAVETDSAVAATAAYAGMVALPDRTSLAALLARRMDPAVAAERGAALAAAEQAGELGARSERTETRTLCAAARTFDRPGSTDALSDDDRARYAIALRRIEVRDAVWIGVDEGRLDGRALWRQLATSLPAPWDAAPLFLFAWASYRAGDGALARIAADRALESDPRYCAADILLAALDQALDPRRLPKLRPHDRDDGTPAVRRRRARAGQRGAAPGAAGRKRR